MEQRIRIARGSNEDISNSGTVNAAGHLLYNIDKQYLYVGNGNDPIRSLEPITTNRLLVGNTSLEMKDNKLTLTSSSDFIVSTNIIASNKKISAQTFEGSFKGDLTGNVAGNANTATNASNVTSTIKGKNITDIFEEDLVTVKKCTKATNADVTNKNTENNNIVNFQIGSGTAYNKSIDNVPNATNASKVQNVDLTEATAAVFGTNTVPKLKNIYNGTIYSTSSAKSSVATFTESITNSDWIILEVEIYRTGHYFMLANTQTRRLWTCDNFNGVAIIPQCDVDISTTGIQLGQIYTYASNGNGNNFSIEAFCYNVWKVIK